MRKKRRRRKEEETCQAHLSETRLLLGSNYGGNLPCAFRCSLLRVVSQNGGLQQWSCGNNTEENLPCFAEGYERSLCHLAQKY